MGNLAVAGQRNLVAALGDTEPSLDPRFPRDRFLIRLGFVHDPVRHPVAEQELGAQPGPFFEYYVESDDDALLRLAAPRHTIVWGPPGSSKTTLRLHLARSLHKDAGKVLAVTCELSALGDFAAAQAGTYFAGEMTKDLLVTLVERFDAFARGQVDGAAGQVIAALLEKPAYRRLLARMAEAPDGASLRFFWDDIGRPGLQSMAWTSPALRQFMAALRQPGSGGAEPLTLEAAWAAVDALGIPTVYALVDGVDATERSPAQMARLVAPFWQLAEEYPSRLYLKLFLPVELEEWVRAPLAALAARQPLDLVRLAWSPAALHAALLARLRAAAPDVQSPADLFAPQDADAVLAALIHAAAGSPRRLFELLSAVIDAHVAEHPDAATLTAADWQRVRAGTPRDEPHA